MPRLEPATRNGPAYYNIMDHRSDIPPKWKEIDEFLRFTGRLDPALKEEVRRAVAQHSGCKFCSSLGEPSANLNDPRVAAAVAFGVAIASNPGRVLDKDFDPLREHFDAAEIVELSVWICFMYGAEMFGAIMNLDPATSAEKKMYAGWIEQEAKRHAAKATTAAAA